MSMYARNISSVKDNNYYFIFVSNDHDYKRNSEHFKDTFEDLDHNILFKKDNNYAILFKDDIDRLLISEITISLSSKSTSTVSAELSTIDESDVSNTSTSSNITTTRKRDKKSLSKLSTRTTRSQKQTNKSNYKILDIEKFASSSISIKYTTSSTFKSYAYIHRVLVVIASDDFMSLTNQKTLDLSYISKSQIYK